MPPSDPILRTDLAGLDLDNPVLLAAGTAGLGGEYADALDLSRLGGIVTKSITAKARDGNRTWRVVPIEVGMLNAVGLANPGLDAWQRDHAPALGSLGTAVIGSISGFSHEDYVRVAAAMDEVDAIRAVELNVSCPNVDSGTAFGSSPESLRDLVAAVRPVLSRTRLLLKLSPIAFGPPTLVDIARAGIEGAGVPGGPNQRPGADGLCIANTMPAMAIDVRTRQPRLSRVSGGLSGPAVHPIAVRLVHEVYRGLAKDADVPIVGVGGVRRWEDAAEFILAGATAVQVGTALFADPRSPLRIIKGLGRWARAQRVERVADLIGAVDLTYPPKTP